MPCLKNLRVSAPTKRPLVEPAGSAAQHPALPFSLTQFICIATLPVPVCVHILFHSRDTLEALKVNLSVSDDDEAPLIAALAHDAPRLRELNLGLRLRADSVAFPRTNYIIATLARVQILSLPTPKDLHDTLDVLAGLRSLRELSLWRALNVHTVDQSSTTAGLLAVYLLRTPCLRIVTVHGYDVGDGERNMLLELCRSRKTRCYITD